MIIKGDFHKLKEWEALFKSAPELMGPLSQDAAEELLLLTQDTFRRQSDPYGIRWPGKKRNDGRAILTGRTTRLRSGWHLERRGKFSFAIAPSVVYAAAHQDPRPRKGWGKRPGSLSQLPRRAMVPYRGLPDEWRDALGEVAQDHLSAHFKRKGKSSAGAGLLTHKIVGVKRRFSPMALVKRVVREVENK